jgi:hypothetical protein
MKNKLLFLLFLLAPAALAAQEHNPSPKKNYTPGGGTPEQIMACNAFSTGVHTVT